MKSSEKKLSIVVPVYNEEGNVKELHRQIFEVIKKNNYNAEIIFVDDGSKDKTVELMKELKPLKMVLFRKNFGQTAAMDAGVKESTGDIIIMLDGDLQNDPADIPRLLEKMDEGYDVVSGWRKNRKDSFSKKFLSRGADKLRKILIHDGIKDSGCSLKAYKKECFDFIDLYGEMHRFIPAMMKINGFKIGEIAVNHRPRIAGKTKYNYKRVIKGFLDMISVWFWRKFADRPLHLFGGIGLFFAFSGSLVVTWTLIDKIIFGTALRERALPIIGVFMVLIGIQLFISGLLADISIKTFHQAKKERPYKIKAVVENK
ncbi:MAG TPA: glycosyltransferase family 2 protein [Candidatus Moranbacteria bacterium]|nr:glycosyltransferase family 2 protein [Candidatus Moranbacteria bacterium]